MDEYEGYTPAEQKRNEIRENRLAALRFVGEVFRGAGDDAYPFRLEEKYRWALKQLEEE